ncbi:hypothetical protein RIF29_29047 [Crotalaria pallida]|uniref:Uncharacterized protein n=1 Tax=Crotalaria pallida TaxID=3830 RepID=A0AAN9EDT4_CROPI
MVEPEQTLDGGTRTDPRWWNANRPDDVVRLTHSSTKLKPRYKIKDENKTVFMPVYKHESDSLVVEVKPKNQNRNVEVVK